MSDEYRMRTWEILYHPRKGWTCAECDREVSIIQKGVRATVFCEPCQHIGKLTSDYLRGIAGPKVVMALPDVSP